MRSLFHLVFLMLLLPSLAVAAGLSDGFESAEQLAPEWKIEGAVSLDKSVAFKESKSLVLERTMQTVDAPVSATSPEFEVAPGEWEFAVAVKSDLQSPDSSYNGTITVDYTDAAGKSLGTVQVGTQWGPKNWQMFAKRAELPAGVAKARFKIRINKAVGQFRIDSLSAAPAVAGPKKDTRITRVMFDAGQPGALLLPTDPRAIELTVLANQELLPEQMQPTWVIRDYWGSEQNPPTKISLEKAEPEAKAKFTYKAKIDFANVKLETGKYYEIHAEFPHPAGDVVREFSSFAILPEAPANKYEPVDIPFTSRSWDNSVADTFTLSARLGIRVVGVRGGWSSEPPYKPQADQFQMIDKFNLQALCRTPGFVVEGRRPGFEKYDEKAMRQGAQNFVEEFGKKRSLVVFLGNEPHGSGERVNDNINAYKAMYEGFKKADPNTFVIGTAVGPEEEYFQKGFQPWCDAYDFHTYSGYKSVREAFRRYRELFKKYGGEKPIWSTETGLNSQGQSRQAIAAEMIRSFTAFFAEGGGKISWFSICFPDKDGKLYLNSDDSMNVFDCRWAKYAPRLDAITYYNMVNSVLTKKVVDSKLYGDIEATLFKDKDNNFLQVLWKEKGHADVHVPLTAGEVKMIGIDGTITTLNGKAGVTINVSEDPVLLLYSSEVAKLPAELGTPTIRVTNAPASIVKGGTASVSLLAAGDLTVTAPMGWSVAGPKLKEAGAPTYVVTAPELTNAREGVIMFTSSDGSASITLRIPVAGKVAMRLLPTPAVEGSSAGLKFVITNNGDTPQDVAYKATINTARPMTNGKIELPGPSVDAYFTNAATGTVNVAAKETKEIVLRMSNVDPLTVYNVTGSITDATGLTVSITRNMAGFVAVPHAAGEDAIDGKLDDAAWAKAGEVRVDQARQYNNFNKPQSKWNGPADLSAKVKFLWDEKNLYLGAAVVDDNFNNPKEGPEIWNMDAIQFISDPARETDQKPGKYDFAVGLTKHGEQARYFLSADSGAPVGDVKDFNMKIVRDETTKVTTYEIAIPWSRLAPFKPEIGNDLGLAFGLPEDEGNARQALMSWFGNVHTKQIDSVGDLILTK